MEFIYAYKPSETSDGKVNFDKLDIEIKASPIGVVSVKGVAGEIQVKTTTKLTDMELDNTSIPYGLNQIIASHIGGEEADISPIARENRLNKLLELGQMALYHPAPGITEDGVMAYLTSIDNYFNSWIRLGKTSILIGKISSDASDTSHPQHSLLNEVVNQEGNTVAEFLMGGILSVV